MNSREKSYKYSFKIKNNRLRIALLVLAGVYMIYRGVNCEEGLSINGVIELNTIQSTIFYYGTGTAALGLVVLLLLSSYMYRGVITLSQETIHIPKIFFIGRDILMDIDKITYIGEGKLGRQNIITLQLEKRKQVLFQMCFDSKKEYEEFYRDILNR